MVYIVNLVLTAGTYSLKHNLIDKYFREALDETLIHYILNVGVNTLINDKDLDMMGPHSLKKVNVHIESDHLIIPGL